MSFISSFEIMKVFVPEPRIFFWIPALIAEAGAVPNEEFLMESKYYGTATFVNGPAILLNKEPQSPPDWIIWVLYNFISIDILFSNAFLNLLCFLSCCW